MCQISSAEAQPTSTEMPSTTRTPLPNHRPLVRPVNQGKAMGFMGALFLAAGLFVLLIGLKVVAASDVTPDKQLIVCIFGGLFALVGAMMLIHVIRSMQRKSKAAQWLQLHPDQPWMAERSWDPHEAKDFAGKTIIINMLWMIFIAIFLVPFHIIGLKASGLFLAVSLFFDLLLVGGFIYQVYLIRRRTKYGNSVLKYNHFPIFLGEPFDVTLVNAKGISWIRKIDFTLRHIELVYETRGTGQNRSTQLVAYELYKDSYSFSEEDLNTQSHEIPVSFLLPQGDFSTALLANPPRYWTLHIHADTPGVDYAADFLLPIYAKPSP